MLRAALLIALALMLGACGDGGKPKFVSTDITGADFGKSLSLADHNGKARTLGDFRGKAVALFFGYTQCPDVCPTTMGALAEVMRLLGPDAERVQVLFVTVDPERDSAALLSQYVPQFHPSFLGLRSDPATIAAVAKDFRIFYQKQEGPTPGSYTVDHTAGTYLYDPEGRLRLYVRHGETPANIAADLRVLLGSGK